MLSRASDTPAGSVRVNGVEDEDKHIGERHIRVHDVFRGSRETAPAPDIGGCDALMRIAESHDS